MCINIHWIAQLTFDQDNTAVHIDDSPVQAVVQGTTTTTTTMTKTKPVGTKDAIDIKKITAILTSSFSADDGVASDDRSGFEVSFTNPNNMNSNSTSSSSSSCHCDLVSTDCLDSISCIPHHSPQNLHALVWIGLETRRAIKTTSVFDGEKSHTEETLPLGKQLQYSTIDTWTYWRKHNILPETYVRHQKSIFVNESRYPDCLKDNGRFTVSYYHGASCFYQGIKDPEDSAGTILEADATRWFNNKDTTNSTRKNKRIIRKRLETFLHEHQPHRNESETGKFQNLEADKHLSPLGNLMLYAHINRMLFNRRPFLDKIYQEKVTSLPGLVPLTGREGSEKASETRNGGDNDNKNHNDTDDSYYSNDPFIVALHMRRGDYCGEGSNPKFYKQKASPLDSPAQTGHDRMCYQTSVYMDAIRRIRQLVPETRPLHVYVATDDVGDVIDEILNKKYYGSNSNSNSNNISSLVDVEVDRWHFLNYSRHHFNYDTDSIEDEDNHMKQPVLGETAVADLWLLSHGHAFVGHLGSRFGKVAWLLATSRHNTFIPFFTVDGHSKYSAVQCIAVE